MLGVEGLDHRHHHLLQQRRRDVDADRTAGGGIGADRVHRLLQPVERLADFGQQHLARFGQHQRLARTIEQFVAEQFLQADNMAAHRALRDVERLRAGGEAQPLADRVECP